MQYYLNDKLETDFMVVLNWKFKKSTNKKQKHTDNRVCKCLIFIVQTKDLTNKSLIMN